MPEVGPSNLPAGWRVSDGARGGVDLRVSSSGRKYVVAVAAALAALAAWKTAAHWNVAPKASAAYWLGLTLFLALFALWCVFADEAWHLENNRLVHRVGFARLAYSRSIQNAELQIIRRQKTESSGYYYRLYAVVDGKTHFLIERDEKELELLAKFIALHTGWRSLP